jgi:hypothetical protein
MLLRKMEIYFPCERISKLKRQANPFSHQLVRVVQVKVTSQVVWRRRRHSGVARPPPAGLHISLLGRGPSRPF